MFFRDSARVWGGILRYSSNRMTLGSAKARRLACRNTSACASAEATPFRISTIARLAAQMLIGS